MAEHEYAVVGHSRSRIGMVIALVSGALAGISTTVVGIVVTYLREIQVDMPDVIIWPITGGFVFSLVFIIFDKFLWRFTVLRGVIGIPDISGFWAISGDSYGTDNNKNYSWSGDLIVTQNYEKINVLLNTKQSSSSSISAAIIAEGAAGYRLLYSYRNDPKPGESAMNSHIGHCDILFEKNLLEASGSYFNGGGRFTHGSIQLKRSQKCA